MERTLTQRAVSPTARHRRLFGRRTKIVCTLGPATSSATMIGRLIRAGMDVVRLNLSHGTLSDHVRYIQTARESGERLGINVAVLMDLPGPKHRVGKLRDGQAMLRKGAAVTLTTAPVEGNDELLPVSLPTLPQMVKVGDTVLLADGQMQLRVEAVTASGVIGRVIVGGTVTEGRGLALPGMRTIGPFVTESLRQKIIFAVQQRPDYIALSFVGSAEDVISVRNVLRENNADIPIVAKIERADAVDNFSGILSASDGIMVARGDLGVEIPLERVPLVQKEIIRLCNRAGKPVITATEMLESMIGSARPTRAETTDVANAVFDGTDATMLSGETAVGKYPVQAVRMMARIARETEKRLPYERILLETGMHVERQTDELISYNACYTAHSLRAAAIVAFTQSGSTALRVARYRPRVPILALTPGAAVMRRLVLTWGVHPVLTRALAVDDFFSTGVRLCKELGLAKPGDLIVITGGVPVGVAGSTNLLKVEKVS